MSAEQNKSRLEQARETREQTVTITHSCGHVVKHPLIGRFGVRIFVAREEGRICMDCVELDKKAAHWARVEARKAVYRGVIEEAVLNLAALEIVQATNQALTGLEVVMLMIKHFENYNTNAWDLCKQVGFAPDEIITLERLMS